MSEPIKAKRATIQIGLFKVDAFMLPDGSYRMSQTQVAQCVGKDESNARKFLTSKGIKSMLGEDYTPGKEQPIEIESEDQLRGQPRFRPLTLNETIAFWQWETFKGNKQALALTFALQRETLERRIDRAFEVSVSEDERNDRITQTMQQMKTDLDKLGEAFALEDEVRRERNYFEQLLRQHGIDPYRLSPEEEGG